MLATAGTVGGHLERRRDWRFEGKWDGIRALATLGPAGLKLHSRAGNDFTHAYPELQELVELLDGHSGVLDGEIVALDANGRTSFSLLQQRMNLAAAAGRRAGAAGRPGAVLAVRRAASGRSVVAAQAV